MMGFLDNLRRAFTGQGEDLGAKYIALARGLALPSQLQPRDKLAHKPAEYYRENIAESLGYARFALADDRANGHKAAQRVFVSIAAQSYVKFLALSYTGGLPLDELKTFMPELRDALAYTDAEYRKIASAMEHNHVLDVVRNYEYAFIALTTLIGLRCGEADLQQLLTATGEGGREMLYDRIAQRLAPSRAVGGKLTRGAHNKLLVEAMDAAPERRAALVKKYLDGWYDKVLSKSLSHDSHTGEAYHGYWSYEAAAVVVLWEIDDSSFRDHPHYPDQLVAYYRETPA